MMVFEVVSLFFIATASLLIIGLAIYFVSGMRPIPTRSLHVQRKSLDDLTDIDVSDEYAEAKTTPATSQLTIPPLVVPSTRNSIPTSLSGMGSNWKPLRGVMPKRMRRFPHNLQQP